MPIYDFTCPKCSHSFAEIKGIKEYSDHPETPCPKCNHECGSKDRDFSKSKPQFIGTKVQSAEFNPGLGCVVKNKQHQSEICRQKGLIEVGNDFGGGEKMQNTYAKKKKEELESNWNKDPSDFFL